MGRRPVDVRSSRIRKEGGRRCRLVPCERLCHPGSPAHITQMSDFLDFFAHKLLLPLKRGVNRINKRLDGAFRAGHGG